MQDNRDEKFHFVIHLVRRRNCEELTVALRNHKVCDIKDTLNLMAIIEANRKSKRNSTNETDRVSNIDGSLITSLICPVSFMRMAIPVRGNDCRHLQCFDCATYLAMNFHKPMWQCPICDRSAIFICLEVDRLILDVINDDRSISVTKVAFNQSGQWRSAMDDECDGDADEVDVGPHDADVNPLNVAASVKETQKAEGLSRNILIRSDWPSLINQFCSSRLANRNVVNDTDMRNLTVQARSSHSIASSAAHPNINIGSQVSPVIYANQNHIQKPVVSDYPIKISPSEIIRQSRPKANNISATDYNSNDCKINVAMQTKVLPRSFTSHAELVIKENGDLNISHFDDATMIPNALKLNERDRRMVLVSVNSMEPYRLGELTGQLSAEEEESIEVYMIKGSCHLFTRVDNERMLTIMKPNMSYKFKGTALSLSHSVLKPVEMSSKLIIEVAKVAENIHKTELALNDKQPLSNDLTFTSLFDNLQKKETFLKSFYTLDGIRNKIVFIDTESAISADFEEDMEEVSMLESQFKQVPISVTIRDYSNQCLFDSMITPRRAIVNYETRIHGHNETHVIGQMDYYYCLAKVHDIVRGRILVGHNLHFHMKLLKINLDHVMGVRDISNAQCYMQHFLGVGQFISLNKLSHDFLGINLEQGIHTSLLGASVIQCLYFKYEDVWNDMNQDEPKLRKKKKKKSRYRPPQDDTPFEVQLRTTIPTIPLSESRPTPAPVIPENDPLDIEILEAPQTDHIDDELGPEPEISLEDTSEYCYNAEPKMKTQITEVDCDLPLSEHCYNEEPKSKTRIANAGKGSDLPLSEHCDNEEPKSKTRIAEVDCDLPLSEHCDNEEPKTKVRIVDTGVDSDLPLSNTHEPAMDVYYCMF